MSRALYLFVCREGENDGTTIITAERWKPIA